MYIQNPHSLQYAALQERVPLRKAVRALRGKQRKPDKPGKPIPRGTGFKTALAVTGLVLSFVVVMVVSAFALGVVGPLLVLLNIGLVKYYGRFYRVHGTPWYRFEKFAEFNELTLLRNLKAETAAEQGYHDIKGAIFQYGSKKMFPLIIHGNNWAYAEYQASERRRRRRKHYSYSVGSIPLPRALPRMLFVSKKRDQRWFGGLPVPEGLQAVEVHPLLDEKFSTYVDRPIDVLRIVGADLLNVLLLAGNYNFEIIGDVLHVYAPKFKDPYHALPAYLKLLYSLKTSFTAEMETYRDARLEHELNRLRHLVRGRKFNFKQKHAFSAAAAVLLIVLQVAYIVSKVSQ